MYAKLIDGHLIPAPHIYQSPDGTTVVGFDRAPDSALRAAGYKPVRELPQPSPWATAQYNETADEILQTWLEVEPPPPSPAEQERLARVDALRSSYRATCRQFCAAAGLEPRDKFADATAIVAAVNAATGPAQQQLFMLSMQLKFLIDELRRPCNDGDDAWDRI